MIGAPWRRVCALAARFGAYPWEWVNFSEARHRFCGAGLRGQDDVGCVYAAQQAVEGLALLHASKRCDMTTDDPLASLDASEVA